MCCVSATRPTRSAATRALKSLKGMDDPEWDPAEDDEDEDAEPEEEEDDTGEEEDSEPPRRRRPHKHPSSSEDDIITDVESDYSEASAPSTSVHKEGSSKHVAPRKWLDEEDERLRQAVKALGEAHWKNIARLVGTRNHVQCLQRWKKVLKPGLVKGLWSPEEDAALEALVERGFRNWGHLAVHMPGRTSKQCRERWCHHLDPSINKSRYSDQEDQTIIALQKRFGNRWSQIAAMLPGRTENAIKIRWKTIQRHLRQQGTGKGGSRRSGGARGGSISSTGSRGGRSVDASSELPAYAGTAVEPEPGLLVVSRAHSWPPAMAGDGSGSRREAAGGGDGNSSGGSVAPAFGYAAAAQAEQLQQVQRLQQIQMQQQQHQQQLQQLRQEQQLQQEQQQLLQQEPRGVKRERLGSDATATASAPTPSHRSHWCDGSLLMPLFEGSSAAAAPSTAAAAAAAAAAAIGSPPFGWQPQHHHHHQQQQQQVELPSPKRPRLGPLRQELLSQHEQQQQLLLTEQQQLLLTEQQQLLLTEQQRLLQHQQQQQQQQVQQQMYRTEPPALFAAAANPWDVAAAAAAAAAEAALPPAPTLSCIGTPSTAASMTSATTASVPPMSPGGELVWATPFLSPPAAEAASAPLQPLVAGELHHDQPGAVRPRASSFDGYAMRLSGDVAPLPQDLDPLLMALEAADADCDILGVEWGSF